MKGHADGRDRGFLDCRSRLNGSVHSDSSTLQHGDGTAEMTFSSYDSNTGRQQSMYSRHISDRVHTLPSYTRDLYVGKHVMSVQQLMLPKGKAEGRLLHPALSGSICSPKLPLLCMPFSYRCRDATSVFRATQSHRVRAADRVPCAPIASCRTWRRMACLALRGTGRAATWAGSLLRRVRGLQATIALASWRYPRRGCMQLMILAPMEGGECRPVPSIEAACIAIHQHVNQIFPTRALCALVA